MTTVAAFDFDGTITKKDTLLQFLLFSFGYWKVLVGFLSLSKLLLLYKAGVITNSRAKEQLFSYFYKGMSKAQFEKLCNNFSTKINTLENQKAMEKIKWHLQSNHRVVIVSASISDWIKPWALSKGIADIIATEIEIVDDYVTGKFATRNCNGEEKARRLKTMFPDPSEIYLFAYGDSAGDKELLGMADKAFYRCF